VAKKKLAEKPSLTFVANLKTVLESLERARLFERFLHMLATLHPGESRMLMDIAREELSAISGFTMRFASAVDQLQLVTERRREAGRRAVFHSRQAAQAWVRGDVEANRYHTMMQDYYRDLLRMSDRDIRALLAQCIAMSRHFEREIAPRILDIIEVVPPQASEEIRKYLQLIRATYQRLPPEARKMEELSDEELEAEARTPSGKTYDQEMLAQIEYLERRFQELADRQTQIMEEISRIQEEIKALRNVQAMQIILGQLGWAAQTAQRINHLQNTLDQLYAELSQIQEETARILRILEEIRR